MADNPLRGHNPKKKFYTAVMVDNADGSLGEHVVSFDGNDMTFEEAMSEAMRWSNMYGGKTYIYECRPVRMVDDNNFSWPEDDIRWEAQRAIFEASNEQQDSKAE